MPKIYRAAMLHSAIFLVYERALDGIGSVTGKHIQDWGWDWSGPQWFICCYGLFDELLTTYHDIYLLILASFSFWDLSNSCP